MQNKEKQELKKYYVLGLPMLGFAASVAVSAGIVIIAYKYFF